MAKPKATPASVNASEMADLKKIIDMQAKQLLQLNKTVRVLQTELKDVKEQIGSETAKQAPAAKATPIKAAPAKTAATKARTPVKKTTVAAKPVAAKTPAKTAAAKARSAVATKKAEPVKSAPAKRGRKLVQPALDTMVPVPVSVSERLNALTSTKKITQTKFAEEVDLPTNLIFDIAAQKVKTISLERIQKISTALKKFETK